MPCNGLRDTVSAAVAFLKGVSTKAILQRCSLMNNNLFTGDHTRSWVNSPPITKIIKRVIIVLSRVPGSAT